MTNAAQAEFDELFREKNIDDRHPEDKANDTDESEPESPSEKFAYETVDPEDEAQVLESKMRSAYYLPSIRSEANTGPKGVIADAHAFEQARKHARRLSFMNRKGNTPPRASTYYDEKVSSDEDNEDSFMKRWRENRLRELQNAGQRIRSRTTSPAKRIYGKLVDVDGEGFLDAIEKVSRDTVVVVFIYDDRSEISEMVQDCVQSIAKKHNTVRFIRLHYQDAEMECAGVPAILAYRKGEKFAGLVPLMDELDDDCELSEISLEVCLRRHQILF